MPSMWRSDAGTRTADRIASTARTPIISTRVQAEVVSRFSRGICLSWIVRLGRCRTVAGVACCLLFEQSILFAGSGIDDRVVSTQRVQELVVGLLPRAGGAGLEV